MKRVPNTLADLEAARRRYAKAAHGQRERTRYRLMDTVAAVLDREVRETRRAGKSIQSRIDSIQERGDRA